jgi:ribulose-bisphosphate carboxylase large chain
MTSRFHKLQPGYSWTGIEKEPYKAGAEGCFCGVSRQTLIGMRGEDARFHLRYFEIPPGQSSSLEKHVHEHAVIGARGKGRAIVGEKVYDIEPMDVLYVAPDEPHQLVNPFSEPFGFFCIVDAERDRPRKLDKEDIARLESSPETKGKYIGYIEGD